MTRRFCDLCKAEIQDDYYNLNVDYKRKNAIHIGVLKIEDICEECYSKIYETIANIKYGDEDVDEEI